MNQHLLLLARQYLIAKTYAFMLIGTLVRQIGYMFSGRYGYPKKSKETKILVESGVLGWESVFYSELQMSLQEYIDHESIEISAIDRNENYLRQVRKKFKAEKPTHYCFDPRTGGQNTFQALLQSIILSFRLGYYKVTPIVLLTDASIRNWRIQSLILTGRCGVIITFLDPKSMGHLFTHKRVIGPMFMPISQKRLNRLDMRNQDLTNRNAFQDEIFFLGSLYPTRVTFFENLNLELLRLDSKAKILVESKSVKIDNEEYWNRISNFESLITTGFQFPNARYKMDRLELNQMVFRISEALAARKLLFCTNVTGMDNYFIDGTHFVGFDTLEVAASKIDFYSKNPHLGREIAENGRKRFEELMLNKTFWTSIDKMLKSKILVRNF